MDLSDLNAEVREKYRPLSPWAYWGYSLLFAIPVVGLICAIIFCFAGENVNRKNYARGMLISLVLTFIFLFIIILSQGLFIFNKANSITDNAINSIDALTFELER